MKGLGDSRPRHLSDSLDPPHEPLFTGPDRNPYLLSPTEAFAREARFPGQNALPGDGLFPLNNQLPPPSSTFPRIHYNSHFEVPEESPFPSHAQATKINRLPANLLDQFEKQLPIHRDGLARSSSLAGRPRPGARVLAAFATWSILSNGSSSPRRPPWRARQARSVAMGARKVAWRTARAGGPRARSGPRPGNPSGAAAPTSRAGGAPMITWMAKVALSAAAARPQD